MPQLLSRRLVIGELRATVTSHTSTSSRHVTEIHTVKSGIAKFIQTATIIRRLNVEGQQPRRRTCVHHAISASKRVVVPKSIQIQLFPRIGIAKGLHRSRIIVQIRKAGSTMVGVVGRVDAGVRAKDHLSVNCWKGIYPVHVDMGQIVKAIRVRTLGLPAHLWCLV